MLPVENKNTGVAYIINGEGQEQIKYVKMSKKFKTPEKNRELKEGESIHIAHVNFYSNWGHSCLNFIWSSVFL